jgi:hypothetical protein
MAKAKKTVLRKPQLTSGESLDFAEATPRGKRSSNSERSRFAPADHTRLTVNISKELHHKLKIHAATHQTTIGQMITQWAAKHVTSK